MHMVTQRETYIEDHVSEGTNVSSAATTDPQLADLLTAQGSRAMAERTTVTLKGEIHKSTTTKVDLEIGTVSNMELEFREICPGEKVCVMMCEERDFAINRSSRVYDHANNACVLQA